MSVLPNAHARPAQNAAPCVIGATKRSGLLRAAIGAAIAVVALVVLYVIGTNVFVRTRLFRNAVSSDPDAFTIEYTSAYSLVPSRVHVDGLTIRSKDSNVEWILALDRCDFRFSLLDLFHRRFRADHVRGDGLSFRVRLRLDPKDAKPELLAALPPVPGFSDPPLKKPEGPSPPLTDAEYNLWSIDLEDVDATRVREIWVQSMRMTGEMHVTGRWLFRPVRWLEVGPAYVDAHDLEVSNGRDVLVSGLHAVVDTTMYGFDVREPKGLEVFEHASIDARVNGDADTANLIALAKIQGAQVGADRRDPFDLRLRMDRGAIGRGTHLEARTHLRTQLGSTAVTGDVKAHLVAETDAREHAVEVSGSTIALDDVATEGKPPTARWWARATLRHASLTSPSSPRFRGSIELTARDASPLISFVVGNTPVPQWVADAFEMPDLHARADVRVGAQTFEILGGEVKGAKTSASIHADLVKRGEETLGAALVERPPFAVGLKMGDSSGVVLLGAQSWFEREAAWLHVHADR